MLCRRGLFSILTVFTLIGVAGGLLLRLNRVDRQELHYRQHTEMLAMAYQAALHSYRLATDIYLRDTIQQPDLLRLFARAWKAEGEERRRLRQQLYDRLVVSYRTLWHNRLRQLHFHLPDGESFLRFHQPERFGDKLFPVRPSVQIANLERRPVQGFEAGRIIDGFRFVTPLAWQGVHIGTVETSIPFRSLQETMAQLAAGREYQCLVSADLINERLFPDFNAGYRTSPLSSAYLIENTDTPRPDRALPLSAAVQDVAQRLGKDPVVSAELGRGLPFSVGLIRQGKGYVVSFLPIKEVTGRLGGYIVCYAREPLVVDLQRSFLVELAIFVALLLGALWLLLRWRCSVSQLAEQTARLQYEETLMAQQERVEHEERARISRELHDGIGQVLLGVKLRLKLLQEGLGAEQQEERQALGQLVRDVQQASAELRNLVVSLRPLPLSGMRIDEAVQWLCRNLEKDSEISLLLQVAGEFEAVDDRSSLVIFRVCQEALANILKHAAARRVQVSLQCNNGRLMLTLADDGAGGAVPGRDGGSGLAIMRERVEQAGGRMTLESPQGGGTRLMVEVPCQ